MDNSGSDNITVVDSDGVEITDSYGVEIAQFMGLIISHSQDAIGAYNTFGTVSNACNGGGGTQTHEGENCDYATDSVFVYDSWDYDASNYLDDIVEYIAYTETADCPADVMGCILWFDASDTDTVKDEDGDAVSSGGAFSGSVATWLDKSGGDHHATQPNSSYYPTWGVNSANGYDMVNFDRDDMDYLKIDDFDYDTSSGLSIMAVLKPSSYAGGYSQYVLTHFESSTNDRAWFFAFLPSTRRMMLNVNKDGGTTDYFTHGTSTAFAISPDYTSSIGLIYDQEDTSYNGITQHFTDGRYHSGNQNNGASAGTVTYPFHDSTQPIVMGARLLDDEETPWQTYAGASYRETFDGDIAEMVVYDFTLGAGKREKIECEWAAKWGIFPKWDLVLWLDAADASTINAGSPSDGDAVTTWNDKSSVGNSFTTSTNSPEFKASRQNGKSGIYFDLANSESLISSNSPDFGTNDFTYFVVAKPTTQYGENGVFSINDAGQPDRMAMYKTAGSGTTFTSFLYADSTHEFGYDTGFAATGTSPRIYNAVYNRANGTSDPESDVHFYQNGNLTAMYTQDAGPATFDNASYFRIGRASASSGAFYNGDIYEILMYERNLTDKERRTVQCYLDGKWDISITPTDCSTVTSSSVTSAGADGPELWFDASIKTSIKDDSGNTADSGGFDGNVATWEDQSGNDRHATQTISSTYEPDFGINQINGIDVLSFDSTDSNYLLIDDFAYDTDGLSVFVVAKTNSTPQTKKILMSHFTSASDNRAWDMYMNVGADFQKYLYSSVHEDGTNWSSGAAKQYRTYSVDLSDPIIHTLHFSPNNLRTYINGEDSAKLLGFEATVNSFYDSTGYLSIGNLLSTGTTGHASYGYDGEIAEVIMYDDALTPTERKEVECYLSNKWDIATPEYE
ncbi:MAG: hypothetical protein COV36_02900 [Alphaproteobacteria bacterium CG11_big_fil_rev_8_21_14_0_20_44_7]|nr:MAG: hypothetical protein COV36_02900 [Alphaproteobacteria bacterium CG11_big_fil_rev_8_21_14_0_20_44_7]